MVIRAASVALKTRPITSRMTPQPARSAWRIMNRYLNSQLVSDYLAAGPNNRGQNMWRKHIAELGSYKLDLASIVFQVERMPQDQVLKEAYLQVANLHKSLEKELGLDPISPDHRSALLTFAQRKTRAGVDIHQVLAVTLGLAWGAGEAMPEETANGLRRGAIFLRALEIVSAGAYGQVEQLPVITWRPSPQQRIEDCLGSKLMVEYLNSAVVRERFDPDTQTVSRRMIRTNWPEIIKNTVNSEYDFSPIIGKIEAKGSEYIMERAHALVLKLFWDVNPEVGGYTDYSTRYDAKKFRAFIERETHGEFDIGELFNRTFLYLPEMTNKLSGNNVPEQIRVKWEGQVAELFEQGYTLLRAIQIHSQEA
ncbi:hypothetical protein ACFL37_00660 [Candidatus Margulisiibacteriota bacterium]